MLNTDTPIAKQKKVLMKLQRKQEFQIKYCKRKAVALARWLRSQKAGILGGG
jgi:hypothetical protein